MAAGLATLHELETQGLVERSARLGDRLLALTRPLVERHDVVSDVRGLGLLWAIEFAEPPEGRRSYRMLERVRPGLFAQLVVVPLFRDHRILSQVAGHGLAVIKGLPPLTLDEDDLTWLADALDAAVARAARVPRSFARFALGAAGARG
jgi:ornithine--oxo-acid transaminase